eukprot:g380.t1
MGGVTSAFLGDGVAEDYYDDENVLLIPPAFKGPKNQMCNRYLSGPFLYAFDETPLKELLTKYVSKESKSLVFDVNLVSSDNGNHAFGRHGEKSTKFGAHVLLETLFSGNRRTENEGTLSVFAVTSSLQWRMFCCKRSKWNALSTKISACAGALHDCGFGMYVQVQDKDLKKAEESLSFAGMCWDSSTLRSDVLIGKDLNTGKIMLTANVLDDISIGWNSNIDIKNRSVAWDAGLRFKHGRSSSDYAEICVRDSAQKFVIGYFQKAALFRSVLNPFELGQARILNYVDFGIEYVCDLKKTTPSSFSIAAKQQLNKNVLAKIVVDDHGPKAALAIRSVHYPALRIACNLGLYSFGVHVSIESEGGTAASDEPHYGHSGLPFLNDTRPPETLRISESEVFAREKR